MLPTLPNGFRPDRITGSYPAFSNTGFKQFSPISKPDIFFGWKQQNAENLIGEQLGPLTEASFTTRETSGRTIELFLEGGESGTVNARAEGNRRILETQNGRFELTEDGELTFTLNF